MVAFALGGCGIRSTPVPVDAGGAPSRVPCSAPGAEGEPRPGDGTVRMEVHLVCGGAVAPVERSVPVDGTGTDRETRLATARELLDELGKNPSRAERDAGFGTSVPGGLEVTGPGAGDPAETLRLSRDPGGLPPFALAQIVCTFTGTAAAGRQESVVLGGPEEAGGEPLAYSCTAALRGSPDAARTAGVPLP
ncbi:hypothetical protein F0L17_16725 [Streptomyces sp. TRM43335]|uniref:Uncharacterized protein n=1 Tax=Streptomyces taklimakanensis TaxID=2569853 RepID=A0A6G2BEU7_9ACTN|nr:hypothetical protein [Streptomyces taklimakanensis]MTE20724.1 hypothetical protein [Streptomyces taklimakanensis]